MASCRQLYCNCSHREHMFKMHPMRQTVEWRGRVVPRHHFEQLHFHSIAGALSGLGDRNLLPSFKNYITTIIKANPGRLVPICWNPKSQIGSTNFDAKPLWWPFPCAYRLGTSGDHMFDHPTETAVVWCERRSGLERAICGGSENAHSFSNIYLFCKIGLEVF